MGKPENEDNINPLTTIFYSFFILDCFRISHSVSFFYVMEALLYDTEIDLTIQVINDIYMYRYVNRTQKFD